MNSDRATLRQEESTQSALNRLLLANLTTLAAGLAWLYVIYAVIHGTLLQGSMRIYMTLLAAVSAGILGTLQHWLSRKTPPASAANAIGAGIATVILANSTAHFWATGEDFQTSNFILLLVGQGLLFVSRGWFAATVGLTWLAWGGVMLRLSGSPHFAH